MTRSSTINTWMVVLLTGTVGSGCQGVFDVPVSRLDADSIDGHDPTGIDPNNSNDPSNPNDPSDPNDPINPTDPVGDPTNSGCISDRVAAPSDAQCTCEYEDCDATSLECHCDLSCYGENCLIGVDENGNAVTSDGALGDCNLSCSPEDDLSDDMTCSASDCEVQPNQVEINPVTTPTDPATASMNAERAVDEVDVVFVVDNSGSMVDNQMAAACALDAFYDNAGANGASYQTGVLTTDMLGDRDAPGGTYDKFTGDYLDSPGMMSVSGSCAATVQCGAGCNAAIDTTALCDFEATGDFVASDDPSSEAALRQLIVQGDNGSNYEGGLEQAFQFYAEQERLGVFNYDTPKEVVVISDEDADGDLAGNYQWLCPFDKVDRNIAGIPNFNPPPMKNTLAACQQDLTNFYIYYFSSRNIVVHGLLYTNDCVDNNTEVAGNIYRAVAQATDGVVDSICHCERFDDFFGAVGESTSMLSTEMCFDGSLPDPDTIRVYYSDTGEEVPRSTANGWSLDTGHNCIVMHGSWLEAYGAFRIDYIDPDAPPQPANDPVACLDAGLDPLLNTIRLLCGGVAVPESASNGYTFDPVTDCFTFFGSWADVDGSTCILEYL